MYHLQILNKQFSILRQNYLVNLKSECVLLISFTEPSAEVDVYWGLNSETDSELLKVQGWLEIMGCGMVDPAVLKNVNINPDEYSGFAFGMGIERIVMLLYQMSDIRMFFENDVRMLEQFKHL
jgi:phenylalanyl-tRNA synthetase alpha chain